MSIQNAILGLLSWRPSSGYELKKVFEESPYLYWSGNNNQIYKSLTQMQKDGLITYETVHRTERRQKRSIRLQKKAWRN
jgi:DNA-binding PadR family transcriptional regulator